MFAILLYLLLGLSVFVLLCLFTASVERW